MHRPHAGRPWMSSPSSPVPAAPSAPPEGPRRPIAERAFPTLMRYAGLAIAMYEGFIDRPPQSLVIGMAALMMAGSEALKRFIDRR